jgi:purine-binding chemotaxis protein CheW
MSNREIVQEMEDILSDEEDNNQEDKYLLFKLGGEEYGVSIYRIQSIEELQKIIAVPDMPEYVKGVINLRGKVVPVIDLRLRFGFEEKEYDDRTCIIIIQVEGSVIGLIVDTVSEVHDIPKANIDPAPEFKRKEGTGRYIQGLGKIKDEVKILLDVSKILLEDDLLMIQQSAENQKEQLTE